MTRKKKAKGKRRPRRGRPYLLRLLLITTLLILAGSGLYVAKLDHQVRQQFEGRRWALPARVYARPLELYPGLALSAAQLEQELELIGYRRDPRPALAGSYTRSGAAVRLVTRAFDFGDSREPSRPLTVHFDDSRLRGLTDAGGAPLSLVRLDPAQIGSFHPLQHEDRLLVRREEIPAALVQALLAVEDRSFYHHNGIDPRGVLRALWNNLQAGSAIQGGSTLTQQLVKNMFLTSERTLARKLNEAIMAVLLELHYGKEEILTAYVNEVFLGQDGRRAVHGFGLASQFYFRRELADLDLPQLALLAGLIKGPSYYDPRRFPERSRERRQVVLRAMASQGFINAGQAERAMAAPLTDDLQLAGRTTLFPAFLDLVRRELRKEYREEDLVSEGLQIFTTLDPQVQWQVEKTLRTTAAELERLNGRKGGIQGAVVVTSVGSGEVEAIAGGREAGESGFNRALDAERPIGSLIKPAVYLTALERGYTLATLLEDGAISVDDGRGGSWAPRNFDQREHGQVPLHTALAQSYNLATVRLGLALGVDQVTATLRRLGLEREVSPYPSLFLGAISLSPCEVSQLYQTLAADGFHSPLRVIRKVLDQAHRPLSRYPMAVEQRFEPGAVFLLKTILQEVVTRGTGHTLANYLDPEAAAGKTGSTDNLRDSWFAGYTGDRLAVVWLGRDDNQPLGLTGAGGAMVVWGRLMRQLGVEPLVQAEPAGIEWAWVDPRRQVRVAARAPGGEYLPFLQGTAPGGLIGTAGRGGGTRPDGWLKQLFRKIF